MKWCLQPGIFCSITASSLEPWPYLGIHLPNPCRQLNEAIFMEPIPRGMAAPFLHLLFLIFDLANVLLKEYFKSDYSSIWLCVLFMHSGCQGKLRLVCEFYYVTLSKSPLLWCNHHCYAKLWAHGPPEAPCCGLLLFFCSLWLLTDQELSFGAGISLAVWKVTLLCWLLFIELWPLLLSPIERRSHWYGLSLTESLGPAWGSLPWEGVSSLYISFL